LAERRRGNLGPPRKEGESGLVEGIGATFLPLGPESPDGGDEEPNQLLTWGAAPNYFEVVGAPKPYPARISRK
jgi:hypothetical protein